LGEALGLVRAMTSKSSRMREMALYSPTARARIPSRFSCCCTPALSRSTRGAACCSPAAAPRGGAPAAGAAPSAAAAASIAGALALGAVVMRRSGRGRPEVDSNQTLDRCVACGMAAPVSFRVWLRLTCEGPGAVKSILCSLHSTKPCVQNPKVHNLEFKICTRIEAY